MKVARYIFLASLLYGLTCLSAQASDKDWIEVRSPHFRVLSNASAGNARRAAREFEQMRAVFAGQFPNYRLDTGAPLLIVAARDENTMKECVPRSWKGTLPSGYFNQGWEKQFAVLRMDQDQPGAFQVVYHEYIHHLLHNNVRALPIWLDEGLAEFYGNSRFEQSQVYVGAPSARALVTLQDYPPMPLQSLLSVTRYYHDDIKNFIFYAESWALTHYLILGPGMEGGRHLNQFNRLLQQGVDQKTAFQQAIGDTAVIDKNLFQYIHQLGMRAAVLKNPPQINEKDFVVRTLSRPETNAELGGFQIWLGNNAAARSPIEEALTADPKLALAHENMGFLHFADGKDDEAAREFAKAYELDSTLYLSLFYKTMLSPMAHSDAPADQASYRAALMEVIHLNKQFAPAFIELAKLDIRQDELSDALAVSRRAEQLEPSRAGYHTFSGRILLLMGRNAEAAESAKYVADRWHDADRDEAMELWNAVPATQRPAAAPQPEPILTEEKSARSAVAGSAEGRIQSVTCGDKAKNKDFVLTLERGQQTLKFRGKGSWRSGMSDTLWYGHDHFNFCQHLAGVRAVVRYAGSSDSTYFGDLVDVGIRDDLPPRIVKPGNGPLDKDAAHPRAGTASAGPAAPDKR